MVSNFLQSSGVAEIDLKLPRKSLFGGGVNGNTNGKL
jgi:hypothetical protein